MDNPVPMKGIILVTKTWATIQGNPKEEQI